MTDMPLNDGVLCSADYEHDACVCPSPHREFPTWYRPAPVSCTTPFLYPYPHRLAGENARIWRSWLQGGAKVHAAADQHFCHRRLQHHPQLQRPCQSKGRCQNYRYQKLGIMSSYFGCVDIVLLPSLASAQGDLDEEQDNHSWWPTLPHVQQPGSVHPGDQEAQPLWRWHVHLQGNQRPGGGSSGLQAGGQRSVWPRRPVPKTPRALVVIWTWFPKDLVILILITFILLLPVLFSLIQIKFLVFWTMGNLWEPIQGCYTSI